MSSEKPRDPLAGFEKFVSDVRARLDAGRETYADRSFGRDPRDLIHELQEELVDVCGWGYILSMRLNAVQAALNELSERRRESDES